MLKTGALPEKAAKGAMVALSAMARPADLEKLIELIRDSKLGDKRIFLIRNLMRSKQPKARTTLLSLRQDPDLKKEIAARLKYSGH